MKTNIKKSLSVLLFGITLAGCTKNEFMPPPEGERIPYEGGAAKTLGESLMESPYQLFYKAYRRSSMDSVLNGNTNYTLLVPDDEALLAGGYTAARIDAMTPLQADSLIKYYTLRGNINRQALTSAGGNIMGVSYFANEKYVISSYYYGNHQPGNTQYDLYYYRHYLNVENGRLLVNAIPRGNADHAIEALNGYIWPIDNLLPLPVDMDFYTYAGSDPKFSIFFKLQTKLDELHDFTYRKIYIENFGFDPGGWGWVDWRRAEYSQIKSFQPYSSGRMSAYLDMMFIPVNDAFAKIGFNNVDEIMQWNELNAPPAIIDFDTWDVTVGFPSDTILAYHWDFGRDNLPSTGNGKVQAAKTSVFFENDLRNEYLSDYVLNHSTGYPPYIMPFSFGKTADGKTTVKVKNSNYPEATILETIYTVMGPVHVVDRLLIPKDYKLN